MKTVSLDLHDWSVLNNHLDQLLKLREHFPEFKVSLFTIPFDVPYETSQRALFREEQLTRIKANLDWLQIIPHGLTHQAREFEKCDYYTMRDLVLPAIADQLERDGLPYEKGFCAPYWLWNSEVTRALDESGWWGALDRNQPGMARTRRTYTYSHSLEEPFWLSTADTLKLHGHMDAPSANNLDDCFLNLFKLPADTRWTYVTDHIETL